MAALASAAALADPRSLWLGAPTGDDSRRSPDEVRLINEMTAQEVETFLTANAVDMGAANQLRREPVHIALAVIERGPLRSCRDPSGVIVARIRDAKKGTLGPARTGTGAVVKQQVPMAPVQTVDPNMSEIDKFLTMNRIDAAGVISLKSESLDVQQVVMSKGPLINSTNPSASLVSRIRLAKEPGAMPGMPGMPLAPGLVPGQPPPPAGTPALAIMPPPPAFTDTTSDMSDEAKRAIEKLGQSIALQAPAPPGLIPQPIAQENGNGQNSAISNVDDKRLQDEALRAIQGLNDSVL